MRLGRPEAAAAPLALFETWSGNTGQSWAGALAHRCRALLDGDEDLFLAALALHEDGSRPFDVARTQLLYGEWLRRGKRKADARAQLRAALETLERIGAAPWAERARTELTATGTTGRAAELGPSTQPHAAGVCRSSGWPRRGYPTRTSPRSCSSARGPSVTTSTRPIRSSAWPPGASWPT